MTMQASSIDLRQHLLRLDQKSYKAYKDIQGCYTFSNFTLTIDRVQGDPFAAPSQMRVRVPQAIAGFPRSLYDNRSREIALRDYLTRQCDRVMTEFRQQRGSGKSGLMAVNPPGQTILERTSAWVTPEWVEVRFVVGLPAWGRRIAGQEAAAMLCDDIPEWVDRCLRYASLDAQALQAHVETAEDADCLRQQLAEHELVAFIANGAVLPRRSGVDDRPLQREAVPFQAPEPLQVTLHCPHQGAVAGLGIPAGVTLIVGGGYHGKSTLLQAIELGVYNHIPGDGREGVVTDPTAVKIRAEDGRSVAGVNISPFINQLPQGKSTVQFSTPNASGSTSQAANIIEAIEAGTQLLLVDEDTAATNFMIRDRRMQALIAKADEPITPFIDKVRQLYTDYGISTILVMGGSGDYFDVADTVIAMENFQAREVTQEAQAIAQQYPTDRRPEGGKTFGALTARRLAPDSLDSSRGHKAVKWTARGTDSLGFGTKEIDLSAVEQLVEPGQVRAIATAMVHAQQRYLDGTQTLAQILDRVMADLEHHGFDAITRLPEGDLVQFRQFELAAAINRVRSLSVLPD
jgi:predicted ABC-class ATPase